MHSAKSGNRFSLTEKLCPHIEIFFLRDSGKHRGFPLLWRYDAACAVYADFASGIDAVLSFPELDQPCFSLKIEINRLAVQNHAGMGRQSVINAPIPIKLLPSVNRACKNILSDIVLVSERFRQLVEKTALIVHRQAAYFVDKLLFLSVTEEQKQQNDE